MFTLIHKESDNEIETKKEFYGYNEIDMSLFLPEKAKLKEISLSI